VLARHTGDTKLLANDPHLLQVAKDIPRHAFREINERVIVTDVHVANVTPLETCLVGDGANDVARLHAVGVADFEAECFEVNIVLFPTPPPVPRPTFTAFAISTVAGDTFGSFRARVLTIITIVAAIPCRTIASRALIKAALCMLPGIVPFAVAIAIPCEVAPRALAKAVA